MRTILRIMLALAVMAGLSSCGAVSNAINPFYEPPTETALRGDLNDHALSGGVKKDAAARKALETMATYQRAQSPRPVKPVMNPAVVRLLWVPDHLNRYGDLVPAHYYYLKVKKEDFNVTDAFELEQQLHNKGDSSTLPFVYGDQQ